MPITASVSLVVPDLIDNEVAFANAAAWNNYWEALSGNIQLDPIDVTGFVNNPYNTALAPYSITIDDEQFVIPTLAQFTSLKDAYSTLLNNYSTLRQELYAAGLISAP